MVPSHSSLILQLHTPVLLHDLPPPPVLPGLGLHSRLLCLTALLTLACSCLPDRLHHCTVVTASHPTRPRHYRRRDGLVVLAAALLTAYDRHRLIGTAGLVLRGVARAAPLHLRGRRGGERDAAGANEEGRQERVGIDGLR